MTRRLTFITVLFGLLVVMAGTAGADEHFPEFTQPVVDDANVVGAATEEGSMPS